MNSVTLYSNGTAVIRRDYPFPDAEPLRIAIPVRRADLDDVVSSLAVFGDVAVVGPPSYTPTNAAQATLPLDPQGAMRDLLTRLAGAGVVVEVETGGTLEGRLVGVQPRRREYERSQLVDWQLVVLTDRGVRPVEGSQVKAVRFTDPEVQAEIDKALVASLGRVRPESSQVELTVRPKPGADAATITYATPVAAWKIRYQLRMDAGGSAELDGQAVVDNDTDDDWTDTEITVITGEPITFSTDLAEVRRPARERVAVVADRAAGAVVAEPALAAGPASYAEVARGGSFHIGGSADRFGKEMIGASPPPVRGRIDRERAEQPEAEVRDGGDFSAFTSPGLVSVGAGRSAILPLFRTAVADARVVLLYRDRDDARRPFRAVRFRNPAAHALGRGVCEVFVDGDFRGKCLLEPARPGAEMTLVHARETGVRVVKEESPIETRRLGVRVSDGVAAQEVRHRIRTGYRADNGHAEAFALEIEHRRFWSESTLRVAADTGAVEAAEIPGGRRYRVPLPAGSGAAVEVVEERVEARRFAVSVDWLVGNVVGIDAPGPPDRALEGCIELQRAADEIEGEIREQEERAKALDDEQKRLLKLIPQGLPDQADAWRADLGAAEAELRAVRRDAVPKLRRRLKEAQAAVRDALARLQYEWTEPAAVAPPGDAP